MPPEPRNDRTIHLLRRVRDGDNDAAGELIALVYDELHRIAERVLDPRRAGQTLQPTALLNEAWMRMAGDGAPEFDSRLHFLATAARAMRSVLIDHARRKKSDKRGGDRERIPLDAAVAEFEDRAGDLLSLEDALLELAANDERLARVVELRFFGGMAHPEIATVLGTSLRTVERDWRMARAWLHRRLVGDEDGRRLPE